MGTTRERDSQIHVRVGADFKRALKTFCAREGTTEQSFVLDLVEAELGRRAPDLWPGNDQRKRGSRKK